MIVIGDVHGQFDMLMKLMEKLPQTKDICFVGDLIDRGPKSKEVIEFVRENNYLTVMGNHEDFVSDIGLWMHPSNGGKKTIESFGSLNAFTESGVIEWIDSLPITIQWENYIISHSYAYRGADTPIDDLLWGRWYPECYDDNIISIFGHTPVKNAQKIHKRHWNIDTGAAFGNKLSAIDLTTEEIYFTE